MDVPIHILIGSIVGLVILSAFFSGSETSLTSASKPRMHNLAKSGKKNYDLFSKGKFAWVVDNEDEKKLIATMKKASRLMIIGNTQKGDQTTDHYSMMGFTKAYNTARKSCS